MENFRLSIKENIQDPWPHAVAYAKKMGGIIPGRVISLKSNPIGYTMKAHWTRWVFIFVFWFMALVHFLLILLPFMVPLDKDDLSGKTLPIAFFGLFWIYLAVRLSMPIGKISFHKDTSDIHIFYGSIIRRHKITIPKESVTFQAYMYKADKPGLRIRYGNTVLALIHPDEPDSELILAEVKNDKSIPSICEKLGECLKQHKPEGSADKGKNNLSLPGIVVPKGDWRKLVEHSKTKMPFLYNQTTRNEKIIIKDSLECVLIKSRKSWLLGLFLLAMGLFIIVFAILTSIAEKTKYLPAIFILSCLISAVFIVPAYKTLAAENNILLKRWTKSLHLKYGFFPFVRELYFPCESMEACIYKCNIEKANKVKKPGQIILSLLRKDKENSELVLATSDTESELMPVFEKLKSFLGQATQSEMTENVALSPDQHINIPTTSLLGKDVAGKKRKYYVINENTVAFKSGWFLICSSICMFITGIVLLFICAGEDAEERVFSKILKIVFFGIVGISILGGLIGFLGAVFKRYLIADKQSDAFYYSPFPNAREKRKEIIKLSDIEAVQLCSVYTLPQSGNSNRETTIYEINAVTRHNEKRRMNITCGESYEQIESDANSFAEFLAVPLIDHTTI